MRTIEEVQDAWERRKARMVKAQQRQRMIEARFRRKYPQRWDQAAYEREVEKWLEQ